MRKIRAKPIITKIIKLLSSGGYIREYKEMDGGNKILMSCPFHKSGQENRPSCVLNFSEYTRRKNESDPNSELVTFPAGFMYCWSGCQSRSIIHGYASVVYNDTEVSTIVEVCRELADSIHEDFEDLLALTGLGNEPVEWESEEVEQIAHEPTGFVPCGVYSPRKPITTPVVPKYALQRGVSAEVCKLFGLFEDSAQGKIFFPYRGEDGMVLLYQTRETATKRFDYPSGAPRVIYGAYELLHSSQTLDNVTVACNTVFIVESVFNALTCRTYGFPAVAMLGSSTDYAELKTLLKRANVSSVVIATDNDESGNKGRRKLQKYLGEFSQHSFIVPIEWTKPDGSRRDINDLTKAEFFALADEARINY